MDIIKEQQQVYTYDPNGYIASSYQYWNDVLTLRFGDNRQIKEADISILKDEVKRDFPNAPWLWHEFKASSTALKAIMTGPEGTQLRTIPGYKRLDRKEITLNSDHTIPVQP